MFSTAIPLSTFSEILIDPVFPLSLGTLRRSGPQFVKPPEPTYCVKTAELGIKQTVPYESDRPGTLLSGYFLCIKLLLYNIYIAACTFDMCK